VPGRDGTLRLAAEAPTTESATPPLTLKPPSYYLRQGGSAGEGVRYYEGAVQLILPQLVRDIERRCVKPRKSDTRWQEYCFHALPTLGGFKGAAAFATPTVLRLIRNHTTREGSTRTAAIGVAGQIGPAGREAVPYMIADLEDRDTYVVQESIHALSAMGSAAAEAIPALERLRAREPVWAKPVDETLTRIRARGPQP
jgi:hypothetical protein